MVCNANPIMWIWTLWRTANIYATRVLALYNVRCVYVCMTKELFFSYTKNLHTPAKKYLPNCYCIYELCVRDAAPHWLQWSLYDYYYYSKCIYSESMRGKRPTKYLVQQCLLERSSVSRKHHQNFYLVELKDLHFFFLFGNVRWIKSSAQKKVFIFCLQSVFPNRLSKWPQQKNPIC